MTTIFAVEAPHGAVLDFALVFAVILIGPVLVERFKVPGIIGLLFGGYLVGSHGLGLIGSGNQTIPELGQLGLLYLMFVAGLELDLRLLSAYRRAAISFGLLTFALPFAAGVGVGIQQGWDLAASLLLGSLLASHTLILYPTIRDAGRSANPAVASAVGATVLTDTLALVVLAGVAGTATGDGSTAAVLAEVGLGLVVLVVVSLLVLPRLARLAFGLWGADRAARYLVAVLSFLAMAMLAEVFGIEGIVGAFFAGIALNRLVPNEGPSMHRIEFFGSAVLVPIFLVSVGLLLDPSVMFEPSTLGLAGLLCAACLGGKAAAAVLTRPLLGFSGAEAGVMFVLTTPQAAATLAATLVGFDIGLFGTQVVNAVLVLILVSILVSTLLADRFAHAIPEPPRDEAALGERVLLATTPEGPSRVALRIAAKIAAADSGLVDLVVVRTEDDPPVDEKRLRTIERATYRGAIDGETHTVVDRDLPGAIAHSALALRPSAVVIDAGVGPRDGSWEAVAPHLEGMPVLVLSGQCSERFRSVTIVHPDDAAVSADEIGGHIAHCLAVGAPNRMEPAGPDGLAGVDPGTLVIAPVATWSAATTLAAGEEVALAAVLARPRPQAPAAEAKAAAEPAS